MGTLVTIQVVRDGPDADEAIARAFGWFDEIETRCTRFVGTSELMQLSARVNEPVAVSPVLFEALQFAVKVAEETSGAFDPTVGHRMLVNGFNREHRTGEAIDCVSGDTQANWRDVELDVEGQTVTLRRKLGLDLGAVAKGLAVDTAARELTTFGDFAIDAGGDLYLGGLNPYGEPWSVGIRHPRRDRELIHSVRVSNKAVCTSGDYERPGHLVDPRTQDIANSLASSTVVASSAMLADALATAAFVLGPVEGIGLLERMGLEGLLLTARLERYETRGFRDAS